MSDGLNECVSCQEYFADTDVEFCPKSQRKCGHHCNHIWSHEVCDWCGYDCSPIDAGEEPTPAEPTPQQTPPDTHRA